MKNDVRCFFSTVATVAMLLGGSTASVAGNIYSGGTTGDYFREFGAKLAPVAKNVTWQDYSVVATDGTPHNMQKLVGDPTGAGLLQGNVFAALSTDPKFASIKVVRSDVVQEAVLVVMRPEIHERSKGSWGAIVKKAPTLRFATGPETSGPGYTIKQFQELDTLFKPKQVTYAKSVDEALSMLADNKADVALMVQFPNPENPRFRYIAEKGLKIGGVIFPEMRGLKIPQTERAAFELCRGVTVAFTGGLWGFNQTEVKIDTACTPLLYATHTDAPADLVKGIADVPTNELLPTPDTGLAKVLSGIVVLTGEGLTAAMKAASDIASKIQ